MDEKVANNPDEQLEEQISSSPDSGSTSTPSVQQQPTPPLVAPPVLVPATPAVPLNVRQGDPITLVLQWLTYAFWGWFALAMLWLAFVSFSFFTDSSSLGDDWSSIVAYPIAAVVVLFLMAGITDFFYMRREPAHKTGVATAIMVVHTVIFALFGVGLVVSVVFILLQMMLNSSPDQSLFAMLYTALVGVLLYAILIARTTLVARLKRTPTIAMGSLGVIALVFVVLCIAGPMMRSLATKQDRQVESALSAIQTSVQDYTRENKKLPKTLDNLSLAGSFGGISNADIKSLLQKDVIEYTPNVKSLRKDNYGISQDDYMKSSTVAYYYRLCATYTHDKNSDNPSRYPSSSSDGSDYSSDGSSSGSDYIDTYSHKKGKQCYTLQATSNDYSTVHPMTIKN